MVWVGKEADAMVQATIESPLTEAMVRELIRFARLDRIEGHNARQGTKCYGMTCKQLIERGYLTKEEPNCDQCKRSRRVMYRLTEAGMAAADSIEAIGTVRR